MNFKLNKDFKPDTDQAFDLIDSVQFIIDARRKQLVDMLPKIDDDTERMWVGYALRDFTKYTKLLDQMFPSEDNTPRMKLNASEEDVQHIQQLVNMHSYPILAKEVGMVTQVWYDGEITSQKSGDLLWQRSLHSCEPGFEGVDFPIKWPETTHTGKGYIFTTDTAAEEIRNAILKLTVKLIVGQQK